MAIRDPLSVALEGGVDPESLALVTEHRAYTLAGLESAVEEWAEDLSSQDVVAGRVHPVVVEPDEAGVLTLLALWRLGATPAPLNPRLTQRELTRARATLDGVDGGGAQAILWTSGTGGQPRGVALSSTGFEAMVHASRRRLDLASSDQWLATLSPSHVGGMALVVRALHLGSTLVARGDLSAEEISAFVDGSHTPVTHMSLVPTQLKRLLDHRGHRPAPDALRCLLLGGAHAPRALLERALDAGWPVALTYGMTEMTSQVATAQPPSVVEKPGSVGRPLDGVEVSIGPDEEILVRGPTTALGYVGSEAPLVDAEGWYHTGDLGEVDDDGDLWVTGRRSDRIVTGGVNVDAVEVEESLRAHPAVHDACVAGVPDAEWGEVVVAWVVPVEGEFDLDEVEAWLRERVSGPGRPRRWVVETELPLNAGGKVDRALVRELMQG